MSYLAIRLSLNLKNCIFVTEKWEGFRSNSNDSLPLLVPLSYENTACLLLVTQNCTCATKGPPRLAFRRGKVVVQQWHCL